MRNILFLLLLAGCGHINHTETQAYPAYVAFNGKYLPNDCVKFNKAEMKRQGKVTDGTPMKIVGYRRTSDGQLKYLVSIYHKRIDRPVEFTAVVKVFDHDTDKIECSK